jgi:hypothetical protein
MLQDRAERDLSVEIPDRSVMVEIDRPHGWRGERGKRRFAVHGVELFGEESGTIHNFLFRLLPFFGSRCQNDGQLRRGETT